MKTIEQFFNEVIASEELVKKFEEAVKSQKLDEFLKENEVEGTAEQFKAYVLERKKNSGEIPEEELDAVAGGSLLGDIATLYFDTLRNDPELAARQARDMGNMIQDMMSSR